MISLELLTEETLEFARDLRNKNLKYFINQEEISKDQQEIWFKKISYDETYKFIIIKDGEKPVGTISLKMEKGTLEIGNVLIDDEHRGKGMLKEILKNLVEAYPKMPIKLEVLLSNKEAQEIYYKLGFKPDPKETITLWK